MTTCSERKSNYIRVYKETRNGVIHIVYICNQCGCEFGASWKKCVQHACQYTEQIKITDCIKDVHTAIFTGHMGSENSSYFRLARKRMQQAFLLHHHYLPNALME